MNNYTIAPDSSWLLPPTAKQCSALARLAQILGIKEPIEHSPSTRWEARQLLYDLRRRKLKVNNER